MEEAKDENEEGQEREERGRKKERKDEGGFWRPLQVVGAKVDVAGATFLRNIAGEDGGALRVGNDSNTRIAHSFIGNNHAHSMGGAVVVVTLWRQQACSVTFTESVLANNSAASGGAIGLSDVRGVAELRLDNATLRDNKAWGRLQSSGGAIHNMKGGATLAVTRSYFLRNAAGYNGGAVAVGSGSHMRLVNSLIHGSHARSTGGAIATVLAHEQASSVTVIRSVLSNNSAANGGAVGVFRGRDGAAITITGSTLSDNSASMRGGAVACNPCSSVEIRDVVLRHNIAGRYGGAVRVLLRSPHSSFRAYRAAFIANRAVGAREEGRDSKALGGAMLIVGKTGTTRAELVNCTIARNTVGGLGNGGGLAVMSKIHSTITRSTFSSNSATRGGAVCGGGHAVIRMADGVSLLHNSADDGGGGVELQEYASFHADGISVSMNRAGQHGGALAASGSTHTRLIRCTVGGSTSVHGGGVAVSGSA
eukprot:gene15135-18454_t